ncbi:undecaprenyldiphospho-muramoylpentapeptide beta-N-acetylglucosaminyltransferase [Helcococcus kunzii]|uniref:UDP-N-acetylglucosamine--N-acetylmuramyl-(pentapeptide) pyrophosphoryl-undecaprenol N-acetylglucosamine transferase n=1 Tax=Helcococcus kunzii ATCC 51366 TaxID=883114 RepID=H3NLS1_9FIRM|nr:undecaprenyldiphospho-muramoylpentapeptide beta-N-acetylglucosaminyltransferase [Helcococcus kunzii]EHR35728.1 undecaprenyldiphospho-muramoylpentapeptide beta-N-acetylglucosaminyltransferase [Helcococcus kunzii ATCC 51366]
MKKENKRIVLTGGGTTGHVSVNLALIPMLKREGWDIYYIGSKNGIERELVGDIEGVKYIPIATGKLRRYLSFQNILDVFKVIGGTIQSIFKIMKIKPSVIFSKGGFVSVPVLVGGWVNRVPSVTHESDLTPGLANKLAQPFVNTVFTTFPETEKYIKSGKGKFLGPVIREDLIGGNSAIAREWLGIKNNKPTLLAMGGSLGAHFINRFIRENIDFLTEKYNVIHACGKDSLDNSVVRDGYYQFEYIKENLKHVFALSDTVISRSGSNAIFEFLYYRIPMILVPLPTSQSRGDQFDNAKSFEENGFGIMADEDKTSNEEMLALIDKVYNDMDLYKTNMSKFNFDDTVKVIYDKLVEIKKK